LRSWNLDCCLGGEEDDDDDDDEEEEEGIGKRVLRGPCAREDELKLRMHWCTEQVFRRHSAVRGGGIFGFSERKSRRKTDAFQIGPISP